jgi:cellulose biosynthesis protein BcsQ
MQSVSTMGGDAIDEIATKINYLISSQGLKTLVFYSEKKSEGKTTSILNISPVMSSLYNKRVLILDHSVMQSDNLERLIGAKKVDDNLVLKTKYDGVDYVRNTSLKQKAIILEDLSEFYDLIIINTTNYRDERRKSIPTAKYDGAILIRTNKTLGSKLGRNSKNLLDINVPIVGIILNEGK